MMYARDNYDLDPGWKSCKGCDCDFERDTDFTADGLCPRCAARQALAEEEMDEEGE